VGPPVERHGERSPAAQRVTGLRRRVIAAPMDLVRRFTATLGGQAKARAILLLGAVLGLNSADSGAVGALADQLEQALRIGHTQLGVLAAVSSAVGAVTTLPMGVLADRARRVRILVIAIAAWAVAMVAGGLATSYMWLLLSRLALGGAVAAASPIVTSLIGDLFPRSRRARVFGWILTGEVLGTGAGLLIAGNVGAALSWRYAFFLLAAASAALAYALGRLLPEPARGGVGEPLPERGTEREGSGDRARSAVAEAGFTPASDRVPHTDPVTMSVWRAMAYLLRGPTFRLLVIASSVGYFFFAGLRTFAVVFVERRFGLEQAAFTGLVALVGLAALAGLILGGRTADAVLDRGHPTARVSIPAAAYIAAALLFIPGLFATSIPVALVLFAAGAAALAAANPAIDAARLDIVPSALWGRAEGLRTVLRLGAEAVAPILFGFAADAFGGPGGRSSAAGLRDAFLIMAAPLLANGVLVWLARNTYPEDVATAALIDRRARS
jgi:predicted MFS family arabinose efflux permease